MRNRRRLTLVSLGLLAGVAVLLAASIAIRQLIPHEYIGAQRAYLSAVERQLAALDSDTTGKRILLVGSSPVIMGLSAEQIENATHVPTRNLAMDSARAVFSDYAAMVFEHIRPGDVLVIADPNLRKSPQMQLPLSCVRHFEFNCIRKQTGFKPHIVEDFLVLFTDRSFGDEKLTRTPRGDLIFENSPKPFAAKFQGSFPSNGPDNMVKLASDVRQRGGCPIFVLAPLLPRPEEIPLWRNEFAKFWRAIIKAGLHDIVVDDLPLWNDPALFHHDEHPSERGRVIWSRSVIAKLQERGLPDSCGRIGARSN